MTAPRHWSLPLRLLHWLMAALILALLAVGWSMTHVQRDLGTSFALYQWHKSYGLLVLPLLALRLLARLAPAPPPVEHSRLERRAAKVAHLSFYALMLAVPMSGWLMAASSPLALPTRPFELFTLPAPVGPDEALFERLQLLHEVLAYALLALLAVHVLAVLKHQLVDRDGILRRISF
ncbi:cytochrome b/b6 domain-containing protein [Ancylobacter sp. Lp-2]|uniref:cytochrome b n=1 Tax=Ancylobacter sp. Lp-2 TaxID=2881339 RepID=UPI001E4D0ED3|nr:cytochrome b/b6 domain-containing protein [Ancylobacter sp. Lp-2]MCB4771385.1 cytochrome b/b6 domain-containing protein [Ancylobacter sp. Lp-2]